MTTQPKLIYYGDPMCSWCYGISDELSCVVDEMENEILTEVVLGGLRPYNTQSMTDLKEFLTHHWEDVHHRSGKEFSYDILNRSDITYDTEPPCRAVMLVREMNPDKALPFFKQIQQDFYLNNKNMHKESSYHQALKDSKIDINEFSKQWNDPSARERIKKDFLRTQQDGVNSFPTLVLVHSGRRYTIAQGYSTCEKMVERIRDIIK